MDYALVLARTLHFAATISASGIVFFCICIAGASIGVNARHHGLQEGKEFSAELRLVFWTSFTLSIASGLAWFALVVGNIGDRPTTQFFADGLAWSVLTGTQFGRVWVIHLLVGTLLAAATWLEGLEVKSGRRRLVHAALAVGFLASLAWAGHAAATPGPAGDIHLAADALHLLAAGAWVGSLLPLAMLLRNSRLRFGSRVDPNAIVATRRFSTLGILAVGTILLTGLINTWNLVGSADAIFGTSYGRLLMLKIALFLAMVCIAVVNRLWLSPWLAVDGVSRKLERNSLIEAGLGLMIVVIVGALGILVPALQTHAGHLH